MPLKTGSLLYSLPNIIYLLYLKILKDLMDIFFFFLFRVRFRNNDAVSSDHKTSSGEICNLQGTP